MNKKPNPKPDETLQPEPRHRLRNTPILGMALLVFLACAPNAWAAGKHKAAVHGKASGKSATKSSTKSSTQGQNAAGAAGAAGAADAASSKTGAGQGDGRTGSNRPPLRESVRQESRIEFDERMLKGQSAAGVIYLFQRTPSDWKSIVEVPDSFRGRTVNVVAPAEEKR